jgi:preprotein translocase subunit SecE
MSATTEESQYKLDSLKWLVIVILTASAIYGNYYFAAESLLYRAIAWLIVAVIVIFISSKTQKGSNLLTLAYGAYNEALRVVWPSRQERNQTTLMVVVVVLIMSMILWGLDTFFGWIASMVIG